MRLPLRSDQHPNIRALAARFATIRAEVAALKAAKLIRKYDPDQPRVPAGEPDGGQ